MMERVVLSLTNRCNLRCRHCYTEGGEPLAGEMSEKDLDAAIEQVAAVSAHRLILSGGEPLMVPERLQRAIVRAKSLGLKITVTTNATLVTPSLAGRLHDLGLHTLQVSLDSDRPSEHDLVRGSGTHSRAVAGLEAAAAAGLHVTVMMVAFHHNWHRLRHLAGFAADRGAGLLAVDRFVPVGRGQGLTATEFQLTSEDLLGLHRELTWAKDQASIRVATNDPIWNALQLAASVSSGFDWARSAAIGCSAGTGSCVVAANGDVFPCTFLPLRLGNLHASSLGEILVGGEILDDLRDRDRLGGKCGRCRLRLVCGGCRAEALASPGGSLLAQDPLCPVSENAWPRPGEKTG